MASVTARQNKDGSVSWRVQFRIDGKGPFQETFDDKKAADQFGDLVDRIGGRAAREVLETRAGGGRGVPTLNEYTARYLDPTSGLLTGISEGTRAGYDRIAARSFLPILGEYPIDAIQKADVGKWVAWQEAQPSTARRGQLVSAKTVRNYHALLSAVLASAVEEGKRPDNPAHRTRLSRGRKEESVFLTSEEFATLLHFVPQRYQSLVLFLAGTGCRWGEATAITWGDLNLRAAQPTVRIDKAWKKGATGAPVLGHPKSARAIRTVSLSPDVVHALGAPGKANELVFRGEKSGGHLWYGRFRTTTWVPSVQKAQDVDLCEAEGLPPLTKTPTIHDLRHSHASWLVGNGVPLPYVQARLGHENIATTVQTYTHLLPDAHSQMAAVVAGALSGVRPLKRLE
jgi:integrase